MHIKRVRARPYLQVVQVETKVGGLPPASKFHQRGCFAKIMIGDYISVFFDFGIFWKSNNAVLKYFSPDKFEITAHVQPEQVLAWAYSGACRLVTQNYEKQ